MPGALLESSSTGVAVSVEFSWKIPGRMVGVLMIDDDTEENDETTLDDETMELEAELSVEDVDEGGGVEEDGVGVGVGVGVGDGVDDSDLDPELEEPDPVEPSVLNTTMLAEPPLGTVTTQKLAPPTPSAETGLVTPLIPSVDGSIEHGRPLHPPPGHSILTPYDGLTFTQSQSV
jgi:hypothetical protein